jgi:hypothetical protein
MDFYTKKTAAFKTIDDLTAQGLEIELIYFKINTEFGFGHNFVDKRIEELKGIIRLTTDKGQKNSAKNEKKGPKTEKTA